MAVHVKRGLMLMMAVAAWGCATSSPQQNRQRPAAGMVAYSPTELGELLTAKGYPEGRVPTSLAPTMDREGLVLGDATAEGMFVLREGGEGVWRGLTFEPNKQPAVTLVGRSAGASGQELSSRMEGDDFLLTQGDVILFRWNLVVGTPVCVFPLDSKRMALVTAEGGEPGVPPVQRVYLLEVGANGKRTCTRQQEFVADRVLDMDPDTERMLAERVTTVNPFAVPVERQLTRFVVEMKTGAVTEVPQFSGRDVEAPFVFFLKADPLRR